MDEYVLVDKSNNRVYFYDPHSTDRPLWTTQLSKNCCFDSSKAGEIREMLAKNHHDKPYSVVSYDDAMIYIIMSD